MELVEFAVVGVISTRPVAELRVSAFVNVSIQGFKESVCESRPRAGVVVLEKTWEDFTEEQDDFHGNLAGGAAVQVRR